MDPTKTLADLLAACLADDGIPAAEACAALSEWIDGGGFLPDVNAAIRLAREATR
jgi:hypothetical protein